jgi:hypothetical protein
VPTGVDRLHVDCSAAGVRRRSAVPVFDGNRITLQYLVYSGQPTLGAAITAYVEVAFTDEDEKRALCQPIPLTGDATEIPQNLLADMHARSRWAKVPHLREWMAGSRLNPMAAITSGLDPGDTAAQELIVRRRENLRAARANLERLLDI